MSERKTENRPNLSPRAFQAIQELEGRLRDHHARLNQLAALSETLLLMDSERTVDHGSDEFRDANQAGLLLMLLRDMAGRLAKDGEDFDYCRMSLSGALRRGEFGALGDIEAVSANEVERAA